MNFTLPRRSPDLLRFRRDALRAASASEDLLMPWFEAQRRSGLFDLRHGKSPHGCESLRAVTRGLQCKLVNSRFLADILRRAQGQLPGTPKRRYSPSARRCRFSQQQNPLPGSSLVYLVGESSAVRIALTVAATSSQIKGLWLSLIRSRFMRPLRV
jgi:hypothetical protein